ncbi:MAG: hypothetical protein NZM28_07945 [Fimbriimonadales bacterium]|nr:hypothetical protein [Fimbriimonadales bacterium]
MPRVETIEELVEVVDAFRQETQEEFAKVRAEMKEGFERVDGEFAKVREEVNGEFAKVRQEMHDEFAKVRAEMQQRFDATDKRIEAIEVQQKKQSDDLARLKGYTLELRFVQRAPSIFGRYWRRVRIVPASEICDMANAVAPLTPEEEDLLYDADAFVMGVRKSDEREIIGVVEVSWRADKRDVERVLRRAEVLSRRNFVIAPVVSGEQATRTAQQLAQQGAYALLLDGMFAHPNQVSA